MSKQVNKQDEAALIQKITDLTYLFSCPEESQFELTVLFVPDIIVIVALSLDASFILPIDDFLSLSLIPKINDYIFNENTLSLLSKINDYIFNSNHISLSNKINDYVFDSNTLSISVQIEDLA